MKVKHKLVGLMCVLMMFLMGTTVSAAQNGASFSIAPILPDNQRTESSYFNLVPIIGKSQTLKVTLYNTSNKEVTVEAELADATTNNNGAPNYQVSEVKKDDSLKKSFTQMATLKAKMYTIPADGNVEAEVVVNYPSKKIDGTILGGISFKERVSKEEKKKSTSLVNRYVYSMAVLIAENEQAYEPALKLNSIFPSQRNYRNYFEMNLQNTAARVIKKMDVSVEIKDEKGDVAYTGKSTNLKMAPNSNFNYGLDLKETKFAAGDYHLKMTVIADGKKFVFEKNFTVDKKDVQQLNESAVLIDSDKNFCIWWVIGAVLILVAGAGTYYLIRKRKQTVNKVD